MPDLDLWPRIEAAINAAGVSRAAAEWRWPQCHLRNCSADHGDIDFVFSMFSKAISESIYIELLCRAVSDPDDGLDGGDSGQKPAGGETGGQILYDDGERLVGIDGQRVFSAVHGHTRPAYWPDRRIESVDDMRAYAQAVLAACDAIDSPDQTRGV